MVISNDLLEFLVCPEDRSQLRAADAGLIERLNQAITEGKLKNRGGERVEIRLDGGLIRSDGKYLYGVVEDIPILLIDEAIPLHGWTEGA